jgi:hypothetical protein
MLRRSDVATELRRRSLKGQHFLASSCFSFACSGSIQMTRLEAIALLLAHVRDTDPEEHKALIRELVTTLGYGDVLEAFEDLHDGRCYPLH